MALKLVTERFWLFEGWFGRLVEVKREDFPTHLLALAEARRITSEG
jgi:hypothetical protein